MTETQAAYHESLWLKFRGVFWDTGLPIPGEWYQDFRYWRDVDLFPAAKLFCRHVRYAARQFWRDVRRG
jgi:hypothetical protein